MKNVVKFDRVVIETFLLIFQGFLHLWKAEIILHFGIVVLHDTKDAIHAAIMHPIKMIRTSLKEGLSVLTPHFPLSTSTAPVPSPLVLPRR